MIRLAGDLAGTVPLAVEDARLELAGGRLLVPLAVHGVLSVHADAPDRVLDGRLITGAPSPEPPLASFVATSLRAVLEDDWRGTQRIAGTRHDRLVHLPDNAWGSPEERRAWRIGGFDQDWNGVSVQFDGWLAVEGDAVDIATRSDDGSRMWLDRDGDGAVGPGEWGDNGWGGSQGATTRVVQHAVPRGVYRYRIQAEDGGGGNCISLLWSDRSRSAGGLDGFQVVPPASFARPASVVVDGRHPLTLAAEIDGPGGLAIDGPIATWAAGARCAGPLRVLHGGLVLAGDLAVPAIEVAEAGSVGLRGRSLTAGRIASAGRVDLGGGVLVCSGGQLSRIGALAGDGELRVDGGAAVQVGEAGRARITLVHGTVSLADRALSAGAITVAAALGGDLPVALPGEGPFVLAVDAVVPADAPADLGILAYARDRHASWHQLAAPGPLAPGSHHLVFRFDPDAPATPAVGDPRWTADSAALCTRAGIRLWSTRGGATPVQVQVEATAAPRSPSPHRLTGLAADGAELATGQRWELSCIPQPFPSDPFDPAVFALDAVFTGPGGTEERIPGFAMTPEASSDGGDRTTTRATGDPSFHLRWRPRLPGAWNCHLTARWHSGASASVDLPLRVRGQPWDGYLRVDEHDPRFFAVDGAFAWPVGANMHAVTDARAAEVLATRPTPQRGILAYDAYTDRFAAAGADLAEVWMAAWNLGLEWNADRPGYAGAGRYNQGNAAALDDLLDRAWSHGMRIVLAVNHLGQGSDWCAPEWALHPYNRGNGGWLDHAQDLFTDPQALAYQERYRRYLVARYADHPAVAAWKLWTEIDLTNMRGNAVTWHKQAAGRWQALDVYRHPLTTHWSGTYRTPDPAVIAVPGIAFPTIDAYHGANGPLAELLLRSTLDPGRGLARLGKPVLVSEYGVNWNGGSREQLLAETASAPFAGLVAGHAGAPMCWWFERIDQDGWWSGFHAIRAFIAGEDLRGDAKGLELRPSGPDAGLVWARAWQRPGRLLGYALDRGWETGGAEPPHRDLRLLLPGPVSAGRMQLAWWDADAGVELSRVAIDHRGGELALACPPWRRHLAFKLWREAAE